MQDISEGKVNLVITKDLSRLGRDYLQTGYYTEQYFQLDTEIIQGLLKYFKHFIDDGF